MPGDCLPADLLSFEILGRDLVEQQNFEVQEVPSAHIVAQEFLAFR